MKKLKQK